jgi:hypothetical protein
VARGGPAHRHRVIIFLGTNDILNTDTFDASYTATGEGSPS